MSRENGREAELVGNLLEKRVPEPSCRVFDSGFFALREFRDVAFAFSENDSQIFAKALAEFGIPVGFLAAQTVVEMGSDDAARSEFRDHGPQKRHGIASPREGYDENPFPRVLGKEIVHGSADGIGRLFCHATLGEVPARGVRSGRL